jgi:hypothetical protein
MKVGAERNKLILLGVLALLAVYTVYTQLFSAPAPITPRAPRASNRQEIEQVTPELRRSTGKTAPKSSRREEVRGAAFRPSYPGGEGDEALDPHKVDPTLHVDLLAKVRTIAFEGVERNIFAFGERKAAVAPPDPAQVAEAQKKLEEAAKPAPVAAAAPAKPAEPSKPKAPPIKWKYYGFAESSTDEQKRAFLLDGEEILIGAEGDVFQKRYRIVRIGMSSIVVEDMQFKDEQTLPLEQNKS